MKFPRLSPGLDMSAEANRNRCGALKNFWYVACLSTELTPDRPLARTLLGTALVLFRDGRGQAAALRDRCLHRHTPLSAGWLRQGRLGCPYHGWVYDGTGRCIEIPALGSSPQSQSIVEPLCPAPAAVGQVERFATLEQDGLVYVFMGDNPLQSLRPPIRLPYYDDPQWCSYMMVTHFANGVTSLVENFMDVPHTVFVHHGWFRTRKRQRVCAMVQRGEGAVCVTYQQERDVLTGLGRLLNPWGEAMRHTDCFYIPNTTRVDYHFGQRSGFVITSQCSPIGAFETLVYTAISYRLPLDFSHPLLGRCLQPLIAWYTRQVIRQDVEIMRLQGKGLQDNPENQAYMSTEADLPHTDIEAYRTWLLAGAQGAGPEPAERAIVLWL